MKSKLGYRTGKYELTGRLLIGMKSPIRKITKIFLCGVAKPKIIPMLR